MALLTPETARRVRRTVAVATSHYPAARKPYAEPPAGSGLLPVLGDYGPPVLGHAMELLADTLYYSRRQYERYGPISWGGAPGTRAVTVLGPEAIGEVLANRDRVVLQRPGLELLHRPVLQTRRDADGLRGAPLPPPDHAAGVQARAACQLPRGDEPGDRRGLDGWAPATISTSTGPPRS